MLPAVSYRILFLFIFLFASFAHAQVPVMLHLSRSLQSDTLDTNLPAELTVLVHPLIMKGEVTLWSSQKKQMKISPSGLQDLEKQTEMDFGSATDIFIYETWKTNNKSNKIEIEGISFTAKTPRGNEVHFGFVKYKNLLPHLKNKINVNVNGSYTTTYEDILNYKMFNYNVVQYDDKVIGTREQSNNIINAGITTKELNYQSKISPVKKIKYEVIKVPASEDKLEKNSQLLLFGLENFLSENLEIFLNSAGNLTTEDINSQSIYITKIEVEELWEKNHDNQILYLPVSLIIYANDIILDAFPASIYQAWNVHINDKKLMDFIREKKFIFTINKINNQNISKNEAGLYEKALYNYDWSRLSSYVKNF
jgi:hypothetical protein